MKDAKQRSGYDHDNGNENASLDTDSMRSRIADQFDLPKDVLTGAALLQMTGQQKLEIQNYVSILHYNSEQIRIHLKTGSLEVHGRRLLISYYTKDTMCITGFITKLIFLE